MWRTTNPKHKPEHNGGKKDDITIVIGKVNLTNKVL